MYAIVVDRGKQYRVEEGKEIEVDRMGEISAGDAIDFEKVLFYRGDGEDVRVGAPTVDGVKVSAKVVEPEVKGEKLIVFKFRRRKDSKTKQGHRQKYTKVRVEKIEAS